jgi:hypothetical protein
MAQLLWGAGIGIVYFAIRRNVRGALVLGACVPSHWLLDYVAHRPDMPIFPGGARYGLGLWNSLAATLMVEYALFAAGIAIYLTVTRARDRVIYAGSILGPTPPSERVIAVSALAIWLTVPWAAWADRHRSTVGADAA